MNANEKIDMEEGKDQSVDGNGTVEREVKEAAAVLIEVIEVIEATEEREEENKGETKAEEENGPNSLRIEEVVAPIKGDHEVLHHQRKKSPLLILPTLYQYWSARDG